MTYIRILDTGNNSDWVRKVVTPSSNAVLLFVFMQNNENRSYGLVSNRFTGICTPVFLHTSTSPTNIELGVSEDKYIVGMKGIWTYVYCKVIHGNIQIQDYTE